MISLPLVAIVSLVMTIAGLIWHAARSFERLERMREDLRELDNSIKDMHRVLYTTVGGRRKVAPIEVADDNTQAES